MTRAFISHLNLTTMCRMNGQTTLVYLYASHNNRQFQKGTITYLSFPFASQGPTIKCRIIVFLFFSDSYLTTKEIEGWKQKLSFLIFLTQDFRHQGAMNFMFKTTLIHEFMLWAFQKFQKSLRNIFEKTQNFHHF